MTSIRRPPGRPAGLTGDDLLTVARGLFMERGYDGASMDEVAKRSRISKASLYREHASKSVLFAAVVQHWAAAGRHSMRPALDRLREAESVRRGLIELADTMRAGILSQPVLEMRRLVIAEAITQPKTAAMYLAESWNTNIRDLAQVLTSLPPGRGLRIDDAVAAATEFTWLVIGAPLNARLLGGDDASPPVERAVDLFLARYGRLELH